MIGLDTNVLVRYVTQDDPVQSAKASNLIESLTVVSPGFVSLVSVVELVWVLQSCYQCTKTQLVAVLETLLRTRELIIEVTGRQSFIGSAQTIASTIDDFVQADASDGFILVPHITPGGLDVFVDQVVPLLQERGTFRADYAGSTLRDHLGLAPLPRPARRTNPSTEVAS